LSAEVIDFLMGSGWREGSDAAGRFATDAAIRAPNGGQPLLELTRTFDPRATEAGDLGLGWRLFLPYIIKSGGERQAHGSYVVPTSMTLRNQLTGTESLLSFNTEPKVGYYGAGLSPWTGLMFQTTGGVYLSDGRDSEIEFAPDTSISVVMIRSIRWAIHHAGRRLVALQTIPRGVQPKGQLADGTFTAADLDDPLDPATFEYQGEEGSVRVLRPKTPGRWEKILVSKEGTAAQVIDRWGNGYLFKPLQKFIMMTPGDVPEKPARSGHGILLKYDAYSRVDTVDAGDAGRVTYRYDATGRLASVVDARGSRRDYLYSPTGVPALAVSERNGLVRGAVAGAALLLLLGAGLQTARASLRSRRAARQLASQPAA
jgi:YD repeat-containing protein